MATPHYPLMDYYFRHYKGGYYRREGMARHSETQEMMVIYQGVAEDRSKEETWARPAVMWDELVSDDQGRPVPRFRPVTAEDYGHVLKYSLECPECNTPQAMGYYSTRDKAWAAMQEQGYCQTCDHEVGKYARSWVSETDMWVLLPFVARHMEGVQ